MNDHYIIDANLLFSAIISGKELYQDLVLNNKFYSPDFCLTEINKYEENILKKTKLSDEKLKDFTLLLFSNITIVPRFLISNESIMKAFKLCKDIDPNDTIYLALSIEFNLPLITRDKKLKNALLDKGYSHVIAFSDFVDEFTEENKGNWENI